MLMMRENISANYASRNESISVICPTPQAFVMPPFVSPSFVRPRKSYAAKKGKGPTRFPQKCRINGSRCQEHQDFVLVRGQRDGIATDSSTLVKVDGPAAVCHLWVVTALGNAGAGRSAVVLFRRFGFLSTFLSLIGSLAEPG